MRARSDPQPSMHQLHLSALNVASRVAKLRADQPRRPPDRAALGLADLVQPPEINAVQLDEIAQSGRPVLRPVTFSSKRYPPAHPKTSL